VNTGTVCEPSTVWCDLAELLDARFSSWDSVLDRTVVSYPIAQVKRTTPVTVSMGGLDSFPVVWEEVVRDSNDMVNLTLDSESVFIRRPGIWVYHFTATVSAATASRSLNLRVDSSIPSVVASGHATWVQAVPTPPANFDGMAMMSDQEFLVTEADLAGVSEISLRAQLTNNLATDVTIYEATASVYWTAEVPA
jgi:hypothetical protein